MRVSACGCRLGTSGLQHIDGRALTISPADRGEHREAAGAAAGLSGFPAYTSIRSPYRLAPIMPGAPFDPKCQSSDGIAVVDVDPNSKSYASIVGKVNVPHAGDEFHHFGWNACSSCLSPNLPHPHVARRYLVVPRLRSSRIYILDTKPDPRAPKIVKTIEPEEIAEKTGYTRPHTVHCGPEARQSPATFTRRWHSPARSLRRSSASRRT
jgi:hypothetical protein